MLYSLPQTNPNSRQSLWDEITGKSHHTRAAIGGIKALSKRYIVHQIVGYLAEFVWGEYLNLETEFLINTDKELAIKIWDTYMLAKSQTGAFSSEFITTWEVCDLNQKA